MAKAKGIRKKKVLAENQSTSFGFTVNWKHVTQVEWSKMRNKSTSFKFLRSKNYPSDPYTFYTSHGYTLQSTPFDSFLNFSALSEIRNTATFTRARAIELASQNIEMYNLDKICDVQHILKFFGIILISKNRKGTPIIFFWSDDDIYSWPLIKGNCSSDLLRILPILFPFLDVMSKNLFLVTMRCLCFTDKVNSEDGVGAPYDSFIKVRPLVTDFNKNSLRLYFPQPIEVLDEMTIQNQVYLFIYFYFFTIIHV